MPMQIGVGDVLTMKKEHPCGCKRFVVLRAGMDFRLRCEGCGREFMIARPKMEHSVKSVEKQSSSDSGEL